MTTNCQFCDKKMGGVLGPKKAVDGGKCWACQKAACVKCAPSYDGTALGWVKHHSCCRKCSEALDRQKAKTVVAMRDGGKREAMHQAVSSLPEWSLPPAATSAGDEGASAVPARLMPVGAARDEARRASRVLLKAMIENYADRDSFATPNKGGGNDSSELEDSNTSDLETPVAVADTATPAKPAAAVAATPTSKLRAAEDVQAQRRLSRGILASLDELNNVAQSMNKSYTAPKVDDNIVVQLTVPSTAPAKDDMAEFERELHTLHVSAPSPGPTPGKLGLDVEGVALGHVQTPEARKAAQRMEAELAEAEDFAAEVGEEANDAELLAQIDSLDRVLTPGVRERVEQDPVANIGEALSSLASAPSNVEASVAMHEDLMEVLQDVRRKERDAKMVAMLDGVEARLKDSLVRVSTPKVRRKVEHRDNKYRAGQTVSARNAYDNCWYAARIVEPDAEEKRYVVQFLHHEPGAPGRTQLCSEGTDLRSFFIGNQVLALYRADGLGLYQQGLIEYVTPEGLYKVKFFSDGSHQLCGDSEVRPAQGGGVVPVSPPPGAGAAAAMPVSPRGREDVTTPVHKKAVNPNMVSGKDLIVRHLRFVEGWVAEQKSTAQQTGVTRAADRRTLLVQAQLLGHVRKLFEVPASQVPPFELRLQDTQKGDAALYAKLQASVIAAADYLLEKFRTLQGLVAHPKADGERLQTVGEKVTRIKDFVTGSNQYTSQI